MAAATWDRGRLARKVLPGSILAGETPAIPGLAPMLFS
jgi:hypothetical protein